MTTPTIFETCRPRPDVLKGAVAEADFAADLAQVIAGRGPQEYLDPARFFANTYPTRGIGNLPLNVCQRLTGTGGEVAAIFRLDTSYGGGKTHGLIALAHVARGLQGVSNIKEFIAPSLLPNGPVRIAAFDGENADPANGRAMGDGVLAHTPWGEIAYALAGKDGYDRVRASDESHVAPGTETLRELFGGEPTLILLDELSVYLRKVHNLAGARNQLTAFLTSLFKAVESAPRAALVYTLAIGKDGRASDAYNEENQFIADRMAEVESVSARMATLLNPTEEDETVQVLHRRLFESIDEEKAAPVIEAYRALLVDRIHQQTQEAESRGFDLDAVTGDDLAMPVLPASPVTMHDLDRIISRPDLMPPGTDIQPLGHQEYGLLAPGMKEPLRVTTDPQYFEENADSVEFWSPGSPLFMPPEFVAQHDHVPSAGSLKDVLDA